MAGSNPQRALSIPEIDGAAADTTEVAIVLRALTMLQMQSHEWRMRFRELEASGIGDRRQSADLIAKASNVILKLTEAYKQLRAHVVPYDQEVFGNGIESFGELALRGQMFVTVLCLRHLRESARGAAGKAPSRATLRAVLGKDYESIDDVLTYVELEFRRTTGVWVPLRSASQHPATSAYRDAPGRVAIYDAAVSAAQREMVALLGFDMLGGLLRRGVRNRRWPVAQIGCSRITCALQIRLTRDADRSHRYEQLVAPHVEITAHSIKL